MPDNPVARPTEPSRAERKMRSLAYNWCARHRIQVLESDVNALVRSLLDLARPEPRPVDNEQPRVPRGAAERAAAIRALPQVPQEPEPSVAERLDDDALAVLRLLADDAPSNAVIAAAVGVSEHRVKYLVGRLKVVLDEPERAWLGRAGKRAGLVGEADPGAASGPVRPPTASEPSDRVPGGSSAPEALTAPSGAADSAASPSTAPARPSAARSVAPASIAASAAPNAPQTPAQGGAR